MKVESTDHTIIYSGDKYRHKKKIKLEVGYAVQAALKCSSGLRLEMIRTQRHRFFECVPAKGKKPAKSKYNPNEIQSIDKRDAGRKHGTIEINITIYLLLNLF